MLLGTLCASLLRNILAEKGVLRAGEGTVRVARDLRYLHSKKKFYSTTSFNKL